ncbi:MAG: 7-carboxy-7-deazaguanine synthase QueE [Roseibacillus sp.]
MKIARLPDGSPEVFRTLQGEGPSIGSPAVFLRLSLCNLHCSWCDTPFTWNWEGTPWTHQDERKYLKSDQIIEHSPTEIADVLRTHAHPGDRLVVTGGEPLLQQKELRELFQNLSSEFSAIEIETNGTQRPDDVLDQAATQYNVSPKLENSGNSADLRIQDSPLQFFAQSSKAYFKFVLTSQDDLAEVLDLQKRFQIPSQRILLMPEGRTSAALAENRSWIAQACLEHGFRLTDRLHVQLWGDERGT